jgi:hypothetical protein
VKPTLALSCFIAFFVTVPARADVQTKGPELFPGRMQVGVTVLGVQAGFANFDPSGYKLTADFSGMIYAIKPGGLWLGGGLNYTVGLFNNCYPQGAINTNCGDDLTLWAFLMVTFEKLIPIPLVPFVRAGLGGDVLFYGGTAGAFVFRFGGGVHYYLLKWLGLGLETNFSLGPGFYGNANVNVGTGFFGTWDLGIGARFAF